MSLVYVTFEQSKNKANKNSQRKSQKKPKIKLTNKTNEYVSGLCDLWAEQKYPNDQRKSQADSQKQYYQKTNKKKTEKKKEKIGK